MKSFKKHHLTYIFILLLSLQSFLLASYPVNDTAVMRLHINDFPSLSEKHQDNPFTQFWNDPLMKEFRLPIDKAIAEAMEEVKKELKLKKDIEFSDFFKGEVLISIEDLKFDIEAEKVDFIAYFMYDSGSINSPYARAHLNALLKEAEENKDEHFSQRKDINFAGIKFHTFPMPQSEDTKNLPEDFKFQCGLIGQHLYAGIGTKMAQEKLITKILKNKSKKSYSDNDLSIKISLEDIWKVSNQALEKAQTEMNKKNKGAPMGPMMFLAGLDLKKVVNALGLFDMKNIDIELKKKNQYDYLKSSLNLSQEPRGLLKMMLPSPNMKVSTPDWVSSDILQFSAQNVQMSEWFSIIMGFINSELPNIAPLLLMQLNNLKSTLGIDFEKDLFQLFDDKIYYLSVNTKNKEAISPIVDLYVTDLKNAKKFEASLSKLLAMNPVTAKLKPIKYMGANLYQFPVPGEMLSPALAFVNNQLVFSYQLDVVQRTVRHMTKGPEKQLNQDPKYISQLKLLPDSYQGLGYHNLTEIIKSGILVLKKLKPKDYGIDDDETDEDDSIDIDIDFSKLPEPNEIKKDFGSALNFTTQEGYTYETHSYYSNK